MGICCMAQETQMGLHINLDGWGGVGWGGVGWGGWGDGRELQEGGACVYL